MPAHSFSVPRNWFRMASSILRCISRYTAISSSVYPVVPEVEPDFSFAPLVAGWSGFTTVPFGPTAKMICPPLNGPGAPGGLRGRILPIAVLLAGSFYQLFQ